MLSPLYTLGHSTRTLEEFLELLEEAKIALLADVRRYPSSRRHPHFSRESLHSSLEAAGIRYRHFEALGGRRKASPESPNLGWRNESFRAYADYMQTSPFQDAVDTLLALPGPTAIVCAEAVPWRCHRNLISDELVRRGVEVLHILGPGSLSPHVLNPMARDEGSYLVYPAPSDPDADRQQNLPLG